MVKRILLLALLVVVVAGCTSGGNKPPTSKDINYRSGTEGLRMNFVTNSPPAKVFDKDPLVVTVELRNMGAEDIRGSIFITGFDRTIIPIGEQSAEFNLVGKKGFFSSKEGELQVKDFKSDPVNLDQLDLYKAPMLVTSCYVYQTIASTSVCIDPDPFGVSQRAKACTPANSQMSGGQGAPIAVTSIEVSPAPRKTRFRFNVENAGRGVVYNRRALGNCNPFSATGLSITDIGIIHVDSVKARGVELNCVYADKNEHTIRLESGKGVLICEVDESESIAAFTTPLTLQLSYGYSSTVSTMIDVVRTP